MQIINANYVVNTNNVNVPNVSIQISTTSSDSAIQTLETYSTNVNAYINEVKNKIAIKEYVNNRFEKDVCASVGLAQINKVTNEYVANIKADNYFLEAKGNFNINTTSGMTSVVNAINRLVNNFFTLTGEITQSEQWNVNINVDAVTYDSKAITANISNIVSNKTENVIFINDIPNSTALNRTFTSYSIVQGVENKEYTIKHDVTLGWVLIDVNNENNIIATVQGIDTDALTFIVYPVIEQSSSSTEQSSSSTEQSSSSTEQSSSSTEQSSSSAEQSSSSTEQSSSSAEQSSSSGEVIS